jgi:hypothetical protein
MKEDRQMEVKETELVAVVNNCFPLDRQTGLTTRFRYFVLRCCQPGTEVCFLNGDDDDEVEL